MVMIDQVDVVRSDRGFAKDKRAGALATSGWLAARGLARVAPAAWEISISLDVVDRAASRCFVEATDTRFHISLSASEWGFYFCHGGRTSWIRVVDAPLRHERDDFDLAGSVPALRDLGVLVHALEERHEIQFRRTRAHVHSTIPGSEPKIRLWLAAAI
jgi:hypothetical protein